MNLLYMFDNRPQTNVHWTTLNIYFEPRARIKSDRIKQQKPIIKQELCPLQWRGKIIEWIEEEKQEKERPKKNRYKPNSI